MSTHALPCAVREAILPTRRRPRRSHLARLAPWALALAILPVGSPARAQGWAEGDQLRISYGPWAYHFSHSDEHVRFNHLLAGELLSKRWTFWGAQRSLIGLAAFDNSFGQFSQYVYLGQEWDVGQAAGGTVSVSLTAGLLHGYKDAYRDKIPFNQLGVAPVIIPSVSWRHQRFSVLATVLGANGFLFAGGWTFDLK